MANARLIHPFDSNQKVFTDPQAITLMLRLWNVFVVDQHKPEYVWNEDDLWSPPIGLREKPGFALPGVVVVVPAQDLDAAVAKLVKNDDVVAIFHHPLLADKRLDDARLIYAVMVSVEAAHRFAGIVNG